MRRRITATRGLLILAVLLLVTASPAKATISRIIDDSICSSGCSPRSPYPVLRANNVTITLQGQFVDLSTKTEVDGPGLNIINVGTATGSKTIQLQVSAGASGTYTVKLHYLVELNGPDTFKVVVLNIGTISKVTTPAPTQAYSDLEITITGDNIGNAAASDGSFPNCHNVNASNIDVDSSSPREAKVHIGFTGLTFKTECFIRLADKAGGTACQLDARYCYRGSDGKADLKISAVAPNAVIQARLFPPVSQIPKEGDELRFTIFLGLAAKTGGEKLLWQLTPSNSFVAAPGSGTDFSPNGLNSVTVPAGKNSQTVTVIFKKAPEGCPTQGCPAQIRARMESQPNFVLGDFQVAPRR